MEAHNLHNSIIYSDSKNAIDLISDKHANLCLNILNSCRQWLRLFSEILIRHCNRKFNHVAFCMVKACRVIDVACIVTRIFLTFLVIALNICLRSVICLKVLIKERKALFTKKSTNKILTHIAIHI